MCEFSFNWTSAKSENCKNPSAKRGHINYFSICDLLTFPLCRLQVCWAFRRVWTFTGISSARGGPAKVTATPKPSSAHWSSRCSQRGWAASLSWVSVLLLSVCRAKCMNWHSKLLTYSRSVMMASAHSLEGEIGEITIFLHLYSSPAEDLKWH